MTLIVQTEAPPLRRDSAGSFRVGNSHVLLELVIRAFEDGATPEAIVQRYPTATLADIYGVIAYYLRHEEAVKQYLNEREQQAEAVRSRIESQQRDMSDLRQRILNHQQKPSA